MQMFRKKVLFIKTSQTWTHFHKTQDLLFTVTFCPRTYYLHWHFVPGLIIYSDILSQDLLLTVTFCPRTYYLQWHFVPGLQKIGTFLLKFLFPDFFPGTFFRWLSDINSEQSYLCLHNKVYCMMQFLGDI